MKEKIAGKNVLVTGAGGFIGSHLVERLVSEEANVRAFIHYNSRHDPGMLRFIPPKILSGIQLLAGDLRDADFVQHAIKDMNIVFHLGALISIPYSYMHPVEVAETNFLGTLNVLMACRDSKVNRLVHTSTSEVYGTALQVPISEEHPLQGQSPYSAAKIGAEKLVESFHCTYDLPVVTIRPFNTYGPRQSARAVIPTIITQALTGKKISLGNLDSIRDFTYVDDTVNGLLAASLNPDILGMTFNLGAGKEISIGNLAQKIIDMIGKPLKVHVDNDRLRPVNSEVMELISDNKLAQTHLGWQPAITLEEGLSKTIEWISSHMDHYQSDTYQF